MNRNPDRPWDTRSARIWNWANRGDLFFPINQWPPHMRAYLLAGDKKNNEGRYNLFVFLVGNGMSPELAADWVRISDAAQGVVVYTTREKVMRHVDQMVKQYHDRRLFSEKRVFDMILRKPVVFEHGK